MEITAGDLVLRSRACPTRLDPPVRKSGRARRRSDRTPPGSRGPSELVTVDTPPPPGTPARTNAATTIDLTEALVDLEASTTTSSAAEAATEPAQNMPPASEVLSQPTGQHALLQSSAATAAAPPARAATPGSGDCRLLTRSLPCPPVRMEEPIPRRYQCRDSWRRLGPRPRPSHAKSNVLCIGRRLRLMCMSRILFQTRPLGRGNVASGMRSMQILPQLPRQKITAMMV